jgi:hypothetical protein
MARPVVLVYQEYAQTTTTPETPDLNCLLVGPCYWVKDYLDDKGEQSTGGIRVSSDYGTKNASYPYAPPAGATDAITIAEPPSNKIGALLDAESVGIFFDACRVLLSKDEGTGVDIGVSVPHNKITVPGGSPLVLADIKAGDYVVIQDPANPGVNADLIKRVQSVDVPGRIIYTTTNFSTAHTGLKLRLEREVNDVLVDASFVVIDGNVVMVEGGVTTLLTGESTPRTVYYAQVYMQYRSLRQDLRLLDSVSSETDITTKLGKVDARNPLAGCAQVALANTVTPIQFFGVKADDTGGHQECLDIIGGRKDVYATVPLTVEKGIIAIYKTQYEQLASVDHAETTGIPQKFRVVLGAQELPLDKVVSPTTATGYLADGLHQSVNGAIANTPITTADDLNVFVDVSATFLTSGVRAGDTLVVLTDAGSPTRVGAYTVTQVYDNKRLRISGVFPGSNPFTTGNVLYYIIRGTGTPVAGTSYLDPTNPGSADQATNKFIAGTGVASASSHVGKILRVTRATDTGAPVPLDVRDWLVTAASATPAQWIVAPTGATVDADSVDGSLVAPICAVTVARSITTRRCFRVIKSALAAHQTALVIAGDALELNNPVEGVPGVLPPHDPVFAFTTVFSHLIAYIPNENDIILGINEDAEAEDPAAGDNDLHFRVNRALTKDDQVLELVSIAQSFNSRRTVLVWPDSIVVTSLVDGSKPRTTPSVKAAADPQPGYYLAAIVGGLTAGLPSHQGLTNLGVASVDQIYHSTRYFSDEQLTHLSDGGWFVFVQDTPSALPYCLHQLTTDPDTLESGEYSVVKNFDFISMFFMDLMYSFLGQYNVTPETLGLLNQSLVGGIDLLKLRKYAKIGAPLLNGTVVSVAESSAAADRAEAYVEVQMPKPLNRIGLHLVSV